MRKTQKSKLVDSFNMEVINLAPKEYIAMLGMGFIWRLSTPSLEDRERSDGTSFTWRDYASKVFDVILSRHRHASQILLVNDRCDMAFSIKDSERNLRSTNPNETKNVFIRASYRFPSARSFQDFLCNPANKQCLQAFLQEEFSLVCREYPNIEFIYYVGPNCFGLPAGNRITDFQCEHIEADTILFFIYSQIRKSGVQTTVVIDAEDTDVLVIAVYVGNTVDGILTIKRKQNIIDCRKL